MGLVAKLIHKSHFRSANYTFFIRSILFKTSLLKSNFSLWKLRHDFATTAINCVSLSLWSLSKDFFIIQETECTWFVLDYERPPHQMKWTSPRTSPNEVRKFYMRFKLDLNLVWKRFQKLRTSCWHKLHLETLVDLLLLIKRIQIFL